MTPEEYQQGLAALGSPLQLVETNDIPVPEGADRVFLARVEDSATKLMKARLDKMSPVGALHLRSRLLERRRLEHRITDAHFDCQAMFETVFVKQIDAPETVGEAGIFLTDTAKTREKQNTFKGIIISAGAKAMDELRSNGMDVGHEVWFVKHVSARFEVETVDGQMEYLLCLQTGDIRGSVDTARALRTGEAHYTAHFDAKGAPEHRLHGAVEGEPFDGNRPYEHSLQLRDPSTGELTPPIKRLDPWVSEDV